MGQSISFNGTLSDNGTTPIDKYRWDFDTDGAYETTGKVVHHTFHSAGTYQVTLQVVTEHGVTNITSRQLRVQQLAERVVVGPEGDFTTIDAAVQAVSPGSTIIVRSGTYSAIRITKSLTVKGDRPLEPKPVIDANETGPAISVQASGVRIDGVSLTNMGSHEPGVKLLGVNNVTIVNNTFRNGDVALAYFNHATNNTLYLNTFKTERLLFFHNAPKSTNIWNSTDSITYIYEGQSYSRRMGNYYPGYQGSDTDGDGIGETPYVINDHNVDHHPLVEPAAEYAIIETPSTPTPTPSTPTPMPMPSTTTSTASDGLQTVTTHLSSTTQESTPTAATTTDGAAGFTVVSAVLAVLLSVVVWRRRTQ